MTERDEDDLREWKEQERILNEYFGEDAILESGEEGE